MEKNDFPPKDLTKEKKLWDIYLASRRIPSSRFNTISTILVFLGLVVNVWLNPQPISETIEVIRAQASSGLSIALSTLGFLIAGFTIFATISQPNLSLRMSEITHEDSGLSYLKHNYFIFMRVFIYYIVFSVFALFIIIFGHKGGLISLLVSYAPYEEYVRFTIVKISYVLLFTGYYFLIMQLKSFVFNTYHAVMTALRWKAEGYE